MSKNNHSFFFVANIVGGLCYRGVRAQRAKVTLLLIAVWDAVLFWTLTVGVILVSSFRCTLSVASLPCVRRFTLAPFLHEVRGESRKRKCLVPRSL